MLLIQIFTTYPGCGLLGYCAILWCGSIPVFRTTLLPPSSGWIKAARSCWCPRTLLHGVTQKTTTWIFIAMKT